VAQDYVAGAGKARLARAQILLLKEKEFIEAAYMIGSGDLRIIIRDIFPNIVGPCVVSETLAIPSYINTEVFLSFIGLGVDPATPIITAAGSHDGHCYSAFPHGNSAGYGRSREI
jgi:oligopeptide transport system permease protein